MRELHGSKDAGSEILSGRRPSPVRAKSLRISPCPSGRFVGPHILGSSASAKPEMADGSAGPEIRQTTDHIDGPVLHSTSVNVGRACRCSESDARILAEHSREMTKSDQTK